MARVGILTFSDGRRYAHEPQIEENKRFEARLRSALEAKGFEVVTGELDRKSTRLNSSHIQKSRMPSSA